MEYPCASCNVPTYGHYFGYCDGCKKLEAYNQQKKSGTCVPLRDSAD
jgi:hypothetical protein